MQWCLGQSRNSISSSAAGTAAADAAVLQVGRGAGCDSAAVVAKVGTNDDIMPCWQDYTDLLVAPCFIKDRALPLPLQSLVMDPHLRV
jgi:hypothetical protein